MRVFCGRVYARNGVQVKVLYGSRVLPEPCEEKLSCTVLRGGGTVMSPPYPTFWSSVPGRQNSGMKPSSS